MGQILFTPVKLGKIALQNRVVMAPMTRNRAAEDGVPTELMAEHYGQRGDAGLIVAEGSWPEVTGQAYCRQPGIETAEHVRGWRRVTDAVHARGGSIVLQIMHSGRIGSSHIKPPGVRSVSSSAVQAQGQIWTDAAGMQDFDVPQALTTQEVRQAIAEHAAAARRAVDAGFDGVELHGTSGYLCMQFMSSGVNRRSDEYGGNAANRVRFAAECLAAMGDAIGAERVGLRLNPGNTYNDTSDENSAATHAELMRQAARQGIAYLHVMRAVSDPGIDAFKLARENFGANLILNDGFDAQSAEAALQAGDGQAISFARHFIANPDLVRRMRLGLPLSTFDRKTLYTEGAEGYNDYAQAAEALTT
ncbi:alkene reductase [Comamonas sp. Y6]|uniref:Alkene reductase n=1 Tax=Comamonas resistens TaxID=3046670 RepID=A0ABY8SY65_9BURK|nr:alkene reductase [Comamonas resistens]MDL5038147.1 alkene reductase [Comamonas resistens]WHS66829.1 alkene reductase [Comamonas resistens]